MNDAAKVILTNIFTKHLKKIFRCFWVVPLVFIVVLFALSGCGASKTSNSAIGRGGSPWGSQNGGSIGTTSLLGECNRVQLSSVGLQGQIGTYYDQQMHQFQSQYLNLNFTSAPASLFSSDTTQIKIYRWSADSTGGKVVNQVAVKFYFADKLNGTTTQPTLIDSISKATLQQVKNTIGKLWLNVPLEKIFDRVIIVLTGLDLQYDAIAFALYDTSVSTMASATGDVLLPAFYANPNTYKNANPNSILYSLHPNYSIASSNASEGDYKQAVDSICLEMSGANSRVPASIGGDTPANSQKALSTRQGLWGLIWQALLSMLDSIGSR